MFECLGVKHIEQGQANPRLSSKRRPVAQNTMEWNTVKLIH